MSTSKKGSLTDITFSALKWNYTGAAARAASSLLIGIVLARLLGPEPFGLVAIAWLVVGFGNLIADVGMGSALVQRKTVSERDIRYVFTIQVCMGIGLTAVLVMSAPLIAQIFKQPKVVPVIWALSQIFVLQALGLTAFSLLRREMDFKRIQYARMSSYLVGFLVLGIPLAFLGFEVWSLVIAQLSQTALFSLFCYMRVRHQIRPLFTSPSNGLFDFGSKVLLSNVTNWTISNIDNFFIGRFFDVVILGLYNRARVLVTTPMEHLVRTIQQVMFSAYSRRQDEPQTVRRVYFACVGFLTLFILPAYVCVALVPETIIHGFFGDKWQAAIPLVVPLALAMPFHAVMAMGGPMLWAQNQVGREFRAQFLTALMTLLVLSVTSWISIMALVWGIFGVSIFRFLLVTHVSLKTMGAPWSSLIRAVKGSVVLLIPTGSMVFLGDHAIASLHSSVPLRLVLDIIIGTGVFLGIVLMAPKLVFSMEMRWLAGALVGRLPLPVRPLLRRFLSPAVVPL